MFWNASKRICKKIGENSWENKEKISRKFFENFEKLWRQNETKVKNVM